MQCCSSAPPYSRQAAGSSRPPVAADRRLAVAARAWGKGGKGGFPRPPAFMPRLGKGFTNKAEEMDLIDSRQQVTGAVAHTKKASGQAVARAC